MRKKCTGQVSIFDLFSNHDIGKELKAMSERLDWHRQIRCCSIKAMDITMHPRPQRLEGTGAQGTPATQCLCAASWPCLAIEQDALDPDALQLAGVTQISP